MTPRPLDTKAGSDPMALIELRWGTRRPTPATYWRSRTLSRCLNALMSFSIWATVSSSEVVGFREHAAFHPLDERLAKRGHTEKVLVERRVVMDLREPHIGAPIALGYGDT